MTTNPELSPRAKAFHYGSLLMLARDAFYRLGRLGSQAKEDYAQELNPGRMHMLYHGQRGDSRLELTDLLTDPAYHAIHQDTLVSCGFTPLQKAIIQTHIEGQTVKTPHDLQDSVLNELGSLSYGWDVDHPENAPLLQDGSPLVAFYCDHALSRERKKENDPQALIFKKKPRRFTGYDVLSTIGRFSLAGHQAMLEHDYITARNNQSKDGAIAYLQEQQRRLDDCAILYYAFFHNVADAAGYAIADMARPDPALDHSANNLDVIEKRLKGMSPS